MVRKDAGFLKKQRLDKIAKAIAEGFASGGVSYEKLLVMIQFNEGLTRKTAAEYVDLILQAKGWMIIEGKIVAELPEEA